MLLNLDLHKKCFGRRRFGTTWQSSGGIARSFGFCGNDKDSKSRPGHRIEAELIQETQIAIERAPELNVNLYAVRDSGSGTEPIIFSSRT